MRTTPVSTTVLPSSLDEARQIAGRVFSSDECVSGVHVAMSFGEVGVSRDGYVMLAADVA